VTITGPGKTTISVITNRTEVSEGLAGLTDDYNTLVKRVHQHIGENAGILSGNSIIRLAQQTLRDVSGFLGSGNVQSMAALGLELSTSGQLSFSAITFNALSTANLQSALTFIGNTTSGFAGNALTRLRGLGDPVSGQIQTSISFLQKTDSSINERIRQAEERVDRLIDNLEKQFLAADGVLARLEAQQRLLTSLLDAYQAQQRSNG
jgi:flagellar capping protein FliD